MFFIPEWLRGFWVPKSLIQLLVPTESSESSSNSELEVPVVQPESEKARLRPARAKGRKSTASKAVQPSEERQRHSGNAANKTQSSGFHQADPIPDHVPMTSADPRYDMMVFRMREIVKQYNLEPLLRDSARRFKTVRELVRFLPSWELERLLANVFPIFCSKPAPCPVKFAIFKPIVMGICDMQPSGSVRLGYVSNHGRKKTRLHFVNLPARVLWFSELLDLIETATDIALVSSEEIPDEPAKTPPESEADVECHSTPVLPATPPLPDETNPIADSIKEAIDALI